MKTTIAISVFDGSQAKSRLYDTSFNDRFGIRKSSNRDSISVQKTSLLHQQKRLRRYEKEKPGRSKMNGFDDSEAFDCRANIAPTSRPGDRPILNCIRDSKTGLYVVKYQTLHDAIDRDAEINDQSSNSQSSDISDRSVLEGCEIYPQCEEINTIPDYSEQNTTTVCTDGPQTIRFDSEINSLSKGVESKSRSPMVVRGGRQKEPPPIFKTKEEETEWRKLRRRRDNHNQIEKRRRVNINDKINQLALLLQQDNVLQDSSIRFDQGKILQTALEYIHLLQKKDKLAKQIVAYCGLQEDIHKKLVGRVQVLEALLVSHGLSEPLLQLSNTEDDASKASAELQAEIKFIDEFQDLYGEFMNSTSAQGTGTNTALEGTSGSAQDSGAHPLNSASSVDFLSGVRADQGIMEVESSTAQQSYYLPESESVDMTLSTFNETDFTERDFVELLNC